MSTRLVNQLGTGVIPADDESWLLGRGIKFAAYFQPSRGEPILIISVHEDIYKRWAEQMHRLYEQEFGLPSQYRIPVPAPIPTA